MNLNNNNNNISYPLNNLSLKEYKSIKDGYESKKYLNKNYTSKSRRKLKTRDKSSKKKNIKKNKNYNNDCSIILSNSEELTQSIEEICNKPTDLTFSSIIRNKLDTDNDQWVIL